MHFPGLFSSTTTANGRYHQGAKDAALRQVVGCPGDTTRASLAVGAWWAPGRPVSEEYPVPEITSRA